MIEFVCTQCFYLHNITFIQHEYRSAEILENILEETDFWKLQQKNDLPPGRKRKLTKEEDLKFIQRMITFSEEFEKQVHVHVPQQENEEDKKRFYEYTKQFINVSYFNQL